MKPRILVIDDEPVVGDALKVVLEESGYEVAVVESGRAGIVQANTQGFSIVVVDLFLSDITGLQAIRSIRQQQPNLPIILMTGKGSAQAFSEAHELGVAGILCKPFKPVDIIQLVVQAMNQKLSHITNTTCHYRSL
jgi:DNA-binding response OmpR family regulator